MSTAVLPDDSIVIRLESQVIHFCTRTRAIHVRAVSSKSPIGGSLLASHPLSAVRRVRLDPDRSGRTSIGVELKSGHLLELGFAPVQEVAMVTARLVAELTRCPIEIQQGDGGPIASGLQEGKTERYTSYDSELDTPSMDDAPTDPPSGPVHQAASGPVEPVFLQLLIESQIAAAMHPAEVASAPPPATSAAERAASALVRDKRRALFELIALASERMPVADRALAAPPTYEVRVRGPGRRESTPGR